MKSLLYISFLITVVFAPFLNFAQVTDSINIVVLRAVTGNLNGICISETSPASKTIGGFYQASPGAPEQGVIFQVDKSQTINWTNTIQIPGRDVRINKIRKLLSGDLIIAGRSFERGITESSVPFISKLNDNGQVLWTRSIGESLLSSSGGKMIINAINEGSGGDILVAGILSGTVNGINADHGLLIRFNNSGTQVFSKLFLADEGVLHNFAGIFLHENRILVFGYLTDGTCNQTDTRSIYHMQVDYNTGSIYSSQRYCFASSSAADSYGFFNNNYRVDKIQDKYILTGRFAELQSTKRDLMIVRFNSQLNIEQSRFVTGLPGNATRLLVRSDNNFNFHAIRSTGTGTEHYAQFSLTIPITNKYTRGSSAGVDYTFSEGGESLAVTQAEVLYFRNSNLSFGTIELVRKNLNYHVTNTCSLRDTNYLISFGNFELYLSDHTFNSIIDNSINVNSISLEQSAIEIIVQKQCEDANVCSILKISGDDTICVSEESRKFIASRNPRCKDSISWKLDPTESNSINTIDDSTVLISFRNVTNSIQKVKLFAWLRNNNTIIDSMEITLLPTGNLLDPKFVLCPGDTIRLTPGHWFKQYSWQNGSTDSIFSVTRAGKYSVKFESFCGSKLVKSIEIKEPVALLAGKNIIHQCLGAQVEIEPTSGYSAYTWQKDANLTTIENNKAIINSRVEKFFYIEAKAFDGCILSDSVRVIPRVASKPDLGKDTTICAEKTIRLTSNGNFKTYTWSTGAASSEISVSSPGPYWLKVNDNNNCESADTILVSTKQCSFDVFMPNAFSPNNDGFNDLFRAKAKTILASFELAVYNRYGQKVFSTTSENRGWDGKFQSKLQPIGTYIWVCRYQFSGENAIVKKGTVLLIK